MRRGSSLVASLTAFAVLATSFAPAFAGDKQGESRYYAPERRVHAGGGYGPACDCDDDDALEELAFDLVVAVPVALVVEGIGNAIKRNTRKRKKKKVAVVSTQGPPPPIVTMPPPRIYQVLPDGSPAPAASAAPAYAAPAVVPAAWTPPTAAPRASVPPPTFPPAGSAPTATTSAGPRPVAPGPTQPGPAMPEGFDDDGPAPAPDDAEPMTLPPVSGPRPDATTSTSSSAQAPACWRERVVYEPAVFETRETPVYEEVEVPAYEDRAVPVTIETVTPVLEDRVDPATGARVSVVVGERRESVAVGTRLERVVVGTRVERREVSRVIEAVVVRPETTRVIRERVRPDGSPLDGTRGPVGPVGAAGADR